MTKSITGKSLICKEKCIQTAEKERYLEEQRLKLETDPVYFISMVSLAYDIYGRQMYGTVGEHEHLFDIYSKLYDFQGSGVQVKSSKDLWDFYELKNKGAKREDVDIYTLVEFFIENHPSGHFILDECPFLSSKGGK